MIKPRKGLPSPSPKSKHWSVAVVKGALLTVAAAVLVAFVVVGKNVLSVRDAPETFLPNAASHPAAIASPSEAAADVGALIRQIRAAVHKPATMPPPQAAATTSVSPDDLTLNSPTPQSDATSASASSSSSPVSPPPSVLQPCVEVSERVASNTASSIAELALATKHSEFSRRVVVDPRALTGAMHIDGSRQLADPVECQDVVLCERLGRLSFDLCPLRDAVPQTRVKNHTIPDWAVLTVRRYAATVVDHWYANITQATSADESPLNSSSFNSSSTGGYSTFATSRVQVSSEQEFFPSAAQRSLPFFPHYTLLRALSGQRLRFNASTGAGPWFAADDAALAAPTGAPLRGELLQLMSLVERRPTESDEADNFTAQAQERYRLDLASMPSSNYVPYLQQFQNASLGHDETDPGLDYLRYPDAAAVLNGEWPKTRDDAASYFDADVASLDSAEGDEALGLPPWTRYAQMKIKRSQQLKPGGDCSTARVLVAYSLEIGLGAEIRMFAVSLSHAMQTGRLLVMHPSWKRWAGDADSEDTVCARLGWACTFLPPSPCDFTTAKAETVSKATRRNAVLSGPYSEVRALGMPESRARDLRMYMYPPLLPLHVSVATLERVSGLTYELWAQRQMIRYLLRGLQPWAEVMVLQELRRGGFPWSGPVVATHYRNGDYLYNREVAPFLQCDQLDTSMTVAMLEEVVWRLDRVVRDGSPNATTAPRPGARPPQCAVRHFFSFDHYGAVSHAQQWFADSVARGGAATTGSTYAADMLTPPSCELGSGLVADGPVLNTTSTFRNKGDDARTLMVERFGKGYLMRVSLGNLFLAAGADAWVNNDASNWAMLINALRYTGGQGRHRAVYADVKQLAQQASPVMMQYYCGTVAARHQMLRSTAADRASRYTAVGAWENASGVAHGDLCRCASS
jgi:hypothetical protein